MSGYEKSKFVALPATIVDEVTCAICLNIMQDPMCTPCCGHSYCRQCIIRSLQMSSNPNTCPNDRQKLLSKDLIVSRAMANILDKQEVYCEYRSTGCPQIMPLSSHSQHVNQCWFNPSKANIKCDQMFAGMSSTVDQLKTQINCQEFEQLKEQLSVWQREFKVFMSANAADGQQVYVEPNTDAFKKKVLESAKTNVSDPQEIECNIESRGLKKKVLKKCREAVRRSADYNQLSQYLIDSLNDSEYEWSVFVGPKHSGHHSMNHFVDKLEVHFGDLSILLVSHHNDADDDDEYETDDIGDDYFDYSDPLADEDDGDDDDVQEGWDWDPRNHY